MNKNEAENVSSQVLQQVIVKTEIKQEYSSPSEQLINRNESLAITSNNTNHHQATSNVNEIIWLKQELNEDIICDEIKQANYDTGTSGESLQTNGMPELILKQEIKEEYICLDEEKFSYQSEALSIDNFNSKTLTINGLGQLNEEVSTADEIKIETDVDANEEDTTNCDSTSKDDRPHRCTQCNYSTNRKYTLKQHYKTHDKQNVEKFYCDQCTYYTVYKSGLVKHKKRHSITKQFQCEICRKDFNYKNGLKVHISLHHPEATEVKITTFQCDKCSYSSVDKRLFAAHKFKKHGDKEIVTRYKCRNCDYYSFYKSNLKQHLLTHSSDKPFLCELCNSSFAQKTNLKIHVKRHHNKAL